MEPQPQKNRTGAIVAGVILFQIALALIIAGIAGNRSRNDTSHSLSDTPALQSESRAIFMPPAGQSLLHVQYILDASESMLETMPDGIIKRDSANVALVSHLLEMPSETNIGLRIYGHRVPWRQGHADSCRDLELVVPVEVGQFETIRTWLGDYDNLGETPLHASLEAAISDMDLTDPDRYNTIVLISDGKETCAQDPCALVEMARADNLNLIFHVIGVDVDAETRRQLECIAQQGGGNYFDVRSQTDWNTAFGTLAGLFRDPDYLIPFGQAAGASAAVAAGDPTVTLAPLATGTPVATETPRPTRTNTPLPARPTDTPVPIRPTATPDPCARPASGPWPCVTPGGAWTPAPGVAVPTRITPSGGMENVVVNQRTVRIGVRDDRSVDGDRIDLYINDVKLLSNYTLTGFFHEIEVNLNSGPNVVAVQALNEGRSPPNTVEIRVSNVTQGRPIQVSRGLKTGEWLRFTIDVP